MNIAYSAVSNVWYRAAGTWFVAFLIIGFDMMIIQHVLRLRIISWQYFTFVWLSIPALMCTLGLTLSECNRVLGYMLVFGACGVLPVLIALLLTSTISFFYIFELSASSEKVFQLLAIIAIIGIGINFLIIRRNVLASKFTEKECHVASDAIYIRRILQIDPYVPVDQGSGMSTFVRRLAPIVPIVLACGYFLQRGIVSIFGDAGFFMVISLITIPYAFHCISRFLGGCYLWIYLIRKIEIRSNKRIYFMQSTDNG